MSEQALAASVDRSVCKGHGRCYMTAPQVFDCDDEGYPVIIGEAIDDAARADLRKAVANCPEQAISIVS